MSHPLNYGIRGRVLKWWSCGAAEASGQTPGSKSATASRAIPATTALQCGEAWKRYPKTHSTCRAAMHGGTEESVKACHAVKCHACIQLSMTQVRW